MKSVIELRLKAAALDYIYESLNYIRDKFNSEITLNEFVNNKRYQQLETKRFIKDGGKKAQKD